MTETEQLLLVRITELEKVVLDLHKKQQVWAEFQREAFARLVGGSEDYLGMFYDKSLLARRREKVRSG